MNRRLLSSTLIAVIVLVLSTSAVAAQPVQVMLDPARTSISWTLNATMHTVHGTFKLKSGQVSFDPSTGTANGELVVDSSTGESGNHSRDDKMHKDVLETKRYPEITFLPKKVTGNVAAQGSTTIQIQGTLHIHGGDHDLTLSIPVDVTGNEVKATTNLTIPYEAWGMKNPSNLFLHVDNKVHIDIVAVGRLRTSAPTH